MADESRDAGCRDIGAAIPAFRPRLFHARGRALCRPGDGEARKRRPADVDAHLRLEPAGRRLRGTTPVVRDVSEIAAGSRRCP